MKVSLTKKEFDEAVTVGNNRQAVHDKVGRYDNKVIKSGVAAHIQGAIGELVVSKYVGLPWDGKFKNNEEWLSWRKTGHDVSGLEVRFTTHRNGRLIIHEKDKNRSIYILVNEIGPMQYFIAGWIFGFEGKKDSYWEDVGYGRPCYYVPRDKLRTIYTLKQQNTIGEQNGNQTT